MVSDASEAGDVSTEATSDLITDVSSEDDYTCSNHTFGGDNYNNFDTDEYNVSEIGGPTGSLERSGVRD